MEAKKVNDEMKAQRHLKKSSAAGIKSGEKQQGNISRSSKQLSMQMKQSTSEEKRICTHVTCNVKTDLCRIMSPIP